MVEFSNVPALWLLTLAIPLVLLYLLKRRRRDVVVPSTMLWKQALEDIRADTPFQKLKSSLLLLLQLLILVLITAILSGPHLVSSASLSRQRILVLDCSASMSRLRLLRINTMPAMNIENLADVSKLRQFNGQQLRELGRLAYPMVRRKGDPSFKRISWDEVLNIASGYLRNIDPHGFAIYTTSRGLTNEVYYVAGKFARLMGTNNIDNAARLCHAASTTALKQTLGIAASSCSNVDWIGTELIVLAGANIANNQPVATKYLYYAKEKGARIVVVNPYREPGLENYWIPSVTKSAIFGTRLMNDFFQIAVGGDVAFYNGVAKILIEHDWIDKNFIRDHTNAFEELKAELSAQSWEMLERHSGTTRAEMNRFAEIYRQVNTAIFIWSMSGSIFRIAGS